MNELKLIEQSQNGDSEAFGRLYEQYAQKIYAFVYHKTFNKPIAEDITSETFLKALANINRFDADKGKFSTWLFTIARNQCTDFFRSHKTTHSIEDAWDIASKEDSTWELEMGLIGDQIKECMQKLTPEQREILTLRFWQDMSYAEIAQVMGKTEDSVKMTASRSIKKLRTIYPPLTLIILLTFSL